MTSNNKQTMKDVSHTAPDEEISAQPVFDRGMTQDEEVEEE